MRNASPIHVPFWRCPKELRVDVVTAFPDGLLHLYYHRMHSLPSVLTNCSHLPRDLHSRSTAGNSEPVILDLLRHVQAGSSCADSRQLIAEVPVQGFEPIPKLDRCFSVGVERCVSAIEVQDLRRLQGCVVEVFVGWVEGMIDLEVLRARNIQISRDADVPGEGSCQTVGATHGLTPRTRHRINFRPLRC